MHNVHRVCPEEQKTIGRDVLQWADVFLRAIMSNVDALVNHTIAYRGQTRAQCAPTQVRLAHRAAPSSPAQTRPTSEPASEGASQRAIFPPCLPSYPPYLFTNVAAYPRTRARISHGFFVCVMISRLWR